MPNNRQNFMMNIRKLNEAIKKVLNEITVYNGSPVDYDKLTYKSIGQGEGHAAHGWGFYFAVNRDIADQYREAGLSEETISFFGKTYVVNDVRGFVDRDIDHNNEALDIVLQYCLRKLKRNEDLLIDEVLLELNRNLTSYRDEHGYLENLYTNLEQIKQDIKNYDPPTDEQIQQVQDSIDQIKNNTEKFPADISKSLIRSLEMELNKLRNEQEAGSTLQAMQNTRESLIRKIGKILNNDRVHTAAVNDTREIISFIKKHKEDFNSTNIFINSTNQGVVKQFDIPDGPYLEEEKTIKEQSTEVKKALYNLCRQLGIDEEEQNTILNQVARETYKDLCELVREKYGYQYQLYGKGKRADKIVSRLLWKNGIKGIHYFGEEDGECYVVFNSKDITQV